MTKAKSNPKLNRRAAGLPIRAALEPRPDMGANLATDIFRAVKEDEQIQINAGIAEAKRSATAENTANTAQSDLREMETISDAVETSKPEILNVKGATLARYGSGQMRVVSLQNAKPRKAAAKPRKALNLVTNANESGRIPMLFERTKAEELYELLFQLTLGADEPCKSVRVRRSDLMASTEIKTRLTLDLNLKRLEENKLIKIESRPGEQEGNIYTVYPLPKTGGN